MKPTLKRSNETFQFDSYNTFIFSRFIVRLADQLPVFHEVELVSRVELSTAHYAGETLKVVDKVLGSTHHLGRWDPQLATRTLGAEPPANMHTL